jgi:hypothetical protein
MQATKKKVQGAYMGNLTDFYKQHRRLFLVNKHENLSSTEKAKDHMLQDFFTYCESRQIYHTKGINKNIAQDYFAYSGHSGHP